MMPLHPHPSAAQAPKPERVLHDKPIPLRMTAAERDHAFACAAEENRSASNFALTIYRLGMAQYELQRGQRHPQADH